MYTHNRPQKNTHTTVTKVWTRSLESSLVPSFYSERAKRRFRDTILGCISSTKRRGTVRSNCSSRSIESLIHAIYWRRDGKAVCQQSRYLTLQESKQKTDEAEEQEQTERDVSKHTHTPILFAGMARYFSWRSIDHEMFHRTMPSHGRCQPFFWTETEDAKKYST